MRVFKLRWQLVGQGVLESFEPVVLACMQKNEEFNYNTPPPKKRESLQLQQYSFFLYTSKLLRSCLPRDNMHYLFLANMEKVGIERKPFELWWSKRRVMEVLQVIELFGVRVRCIMFASGVKWLMEKLVAAVEIISKQGNKDLSVLEVDAWVGI